MSLQVDGDCRYDARKSIMLWSIDIIDASNRTGSLEFVVPNTRPEAFFPVTVNFNATRTLCQVCKYSCTLLSCMCSMHHGTSLPVWNIWTTLQVSAPSAAELISIVASPEAEAYDSALYVHSAHCHKVVHHLFREMLALLPQQCCDFASCQSHVTCSGCGPGLEIVCCIPSQ